MVKIATVNVNGIRAAARKDMADWLKASSPDVLCLQEVRAPRQDLVELSTTGPLATKKWQIFDHEATAKGRAGVALLTELKTLGSRVELGPTEFDSAGRWLEVDIETKAGTLTVVSTYVHSGEADTPKQVEKYKFLEAMRARMAELAKDDRLAVVVGDLNVGHTELDIKTGRATSKTPGFCQRSAPTSMTLPPKAGSISVGTSTPKLLVPTPGGPTEERPLTPMRAGELTTS